MIAPLALIGYLGYRQFARSRELAAEPVRFTGSRRAGWYSGNDFPVTHTKAPQPEQITPENWRMDVQGAVRQPLHFDYAAFSQLPTSELDATLDCTLGWYARQAWQGVRLADLLEQAGLDQVPTSILFESVTGYAYALPWNEAQHVLLATHVGGEVLSAAHGYPLRAVVPSRRGWFWVKWITRIEVSSLRRG